MKKEIWKDIKLYEGCYQISNLGRVKSLSRTTSHNHVLPEIILKPSLCRGYKIVCLRRNGRYYSGKVYRLVAEAFIPNPENHPQVNHVDEDKTNNCVNNLEWVSVKDNINHGTGKIRRSITIRNSKFGQKRGVCWHNGNKKWMASIREHGKKVFIGYYDDKEEAYLAFYNYYYKIHFTYPW